MESRSTNAKGGGGPPEGFANAKVIVERVSETEVRICEVADIPEEEVRFVEEATVTLSDRDRDRFLDLLDHPPEPNAALASAVQRHARPQGGASGGSRTGEAGRFE